MVKVNDVATGATRDDVDKSFVNSETEAGFPVILNGFVEKTRYETIDGKKTVVERIIIGRRYACSLRGEKKKPQNSGQKTGDKEIRVRLSHSCNCPFSFTTLWDQQENGTWTSTVKTIIGKHEHPVVKLTDNSKVRMAEFYTKGRQGKVSYSGEKLCDLWLLYEGYPESSWCYVRL